MNTIPWEHPLTYDIHGCLNIFACMIRSIRAPDKNKLATIKMVTNKKSHIIKVGSLSWLSTWVALVMIKVIWIFHTLFHSFTLHLCRFIVASLAHVIPNKKSSLFFANFNQYRTYIICIDTFRTRSLIRSLSKHGCYVCECMWFVYFVRLEF